MAHTYGIILFDGFELLDVFGPAEAFGMVKHFDAATRLLMITHDGEPATSAQGPRVLADASFADCPPLDLLLLPGGIGTREGVADDAQKAFLRAPRGQHRAHDHGLHRVRRLRRRRAPRWTPRDE